MIKVLTILTYPENVLTFFLLAMKLVYLRIQSASYLQEM